MVNDELLVRIKKVLALTRSPNKNEAEAAMQMATKLMTEHNLTMQMLEKRSDKVTEHYGRSIVLDGGKAAPERKYIWQLLEDFFSSASLTRPTISTVAG